MEKLLTVKELALLLGVTPTCVYRWLGDNSYRPFASVSAVCGSDRVTSRNWWKISNAREL